MFKRLAKIITMSLCLVMLISSFSYLNATAYSLGVSPVHQAKTNWCWAACAEMAGKYYNQSAARTQWDAVNYFKGTSYDPYPNATGSLEDSANASTYITGTGKTFYYTYSTFSSDQIRNQINNNFQPVEAALGNYINGVRCGGHVVIISAIDDNCNIYYIDPSSGQGKWMFISTFFYGGVSGYQYDETVWTY